MSQAFEDCHSAAHYLNGTKEGRGVRKIPQVYVDVLYGRALSPLRREWQSNYRKTGNGGEFSFAAMAKREREKEGR